MELVNEDVRESLAPQGRGAVEQSQGVEGGPTEATQVGELSSLRGLRCPRVPDLPLRLALPSSFLSFALSLYEMRLGLSCKHWEFVDSRVVALVVASPRADRTDLARQIDRVERATDWF